MTTRSTHTVPSYHWLPPLYGPMRKVTITSLDGTEYDFTDYMSACKINNAATDEVGGFELEFYDPDLRYQGLFTGGETFVYYCDYAATATTARFKGYLEKPNYKDYKVVLSGRANTKFLADRSVTKQYSAQNCDVIIKDLIDSYGGDRFTYVGVDTSTVSMTVNWYQKPFMDCINEVCQAAGFDFYIDAYDDAQFFEVGSRSNDIDAMVHEQNLFETGDFADDLSQIRNRIIVYGANQDGIQLLYTAEDLESQALYGIKEEPINNNNLTTYAQCQEYADYKLALSKTPPKTGEVTGLLLSSVAPGDMLLISDPMNNIQPGRYQVISYEHDLIDFTTTLNISKEPRKFSHIIKSMIDSLNIQQDTSINPHDMRYSLVDLFDIDSGSHTNTQITNGVLTPTVVSGTWESDTRALPSNLSQAYLVFKGESVNNIVVQFSGDNGAHWVTIANKELKDAGNAIGTNLKVRVVFSGAAASVDSISLMYKLQGDGV